MALGKYHVIRDLNTLEALRDYLLSPAVETIWFDLETTGIKWMDDEILCISLSGAIGEGFVVPILHNRGDGVPELFPPWKALPNGFTDVENILYEIFASDKPKGGHNVIFDIRMLERSHREPHITAATAFGFRVNGKIRDTELLHAAIAEGLPHNMTSCLALYTDMPYYEHEIKGHKKQMAKAPNDILWQYSAADADGLPRLWAAMRPVAEEEGVDWVLDNITTPMIRVCRDMENRGFPIDVPYFDRLNAFYELEIQNTEQELWACVPGIPAPWKYNYPPTLSKVLFKHLGLKPSGRKTDASRQCKECSAGTCVDHDQTGKEALAEIQALTPHPILPILLKLKRLTKHYSTNLAGGRGGFRRYIKPDERVHSSMKISRAETGRLASETPNCQNIPNYVHIHPIGATCTDSKCKAFYPETYGIDTTNAFHDMVRAPKGRGIMNVDWSQLEIWVLAYRIERDLGDRTLLEVLESGVDIHLWMARKMYHDIDPQMSDQDWKNAHPDLRRRAKTVNFGVGYGLTPQGLMAREGCTEQEADDTIARYKSVVPIDRYFSMIRQQLQRDKYVDDEFGRRRHIKYLNILKSMGERGDFEGAIREGYNMPIQAGGSDLHSHSSLVTSQLDALTKRGCFIILSVHDSLTFEFDWPDEEYALVTAWMIKNLWSDIAWSMIKQDGVTPLHWRTPCEVEWGKTWGTPQFKLNARGVLETLTEPDEDEDEETYEAKLGGRPTLFGGRKLEEEVEDDND